MMQRINESPSHRAHDQSGGDRREGLIEKFPDRRCVGRFSQTRMDGD